MNKVFRTAALLFFPLVLSPFAVAQAMPSATQPLHISAFGGLTGSYTGLESSKNIGLTAGVDVGFRPFYRLYPSVEVRGTYPVDSGTVAGEQNILFGLKVERPYLGVLHPYGNILYGRNKIDYQGAGYPNAQGDLLYIDSIGSLFSFGGGVDIDLTHYFAAKVDAQIERYQTPVTSSGDIYAKAFTAGFVYRFDFNRHFRYDRKTDQVKNLPKEATPKTLPPPTPPTVQEEAAPPPTDNPSPADATAPTPSTSSPTAPAAPAPDASPAPAASSAAASAPDAQSTPESAPAPAPSPAPPTQQPQ